MPYDSIAQAKAAGFPTTADGIDLTISQVNRLAEIYDAIKKAGTADNPMAAAWTQWKKLYKKVGEIWVELAAARNIPNGLEPATLAFKQSAELNFTDDPATGDTIFHDVILIAEGTWTDGHNRKPIHYSGKQLKNMKIEERKFKANHDIFGESAITNDVGIIENMKFVETPTARWLGDVRVFPTQNGKDITTLLKRGAITDISSELFSIHVKKDGKTNATDIIFMGAASVRTGACTVCTFNEGVETMTEETAGTTGAESSDEQKAEVAALESQVDETKSADIKALEAQLEEAKKSRSNQTATELFGANQRIAELEAQNKELSRKVAELEHGDRVKDLQKQINELSKAPVIHTRIQAQGAPQVAAAELDSGEYPAYSAMDME